MAEGVLSREEADALGGEARRKKQSPLALLVEQGRLSRGGFQSIRAEAMTDPVWRAGHDALASTCTMPAPSPGGDPPFPVAGWDRYTSVRFLGQGGMGMVFLAVDTRLRREVAIKFVRGNDADHVRRLISEARNQARVSHERICKVYEVDEVEGKVYIAMQYIAGKPLGRMSDELTLEQKVTLVRGAAEGIHAAHTEGIIHRDIKPSNVMVERRDDGELRPYVMDFGLARMVQDVGETMTGAVVGTPRYMAPEQAQGATSGLDRRADVYSLGATLYHLVTGAPPVYGEAVAEVIRNLIDGEPRPLRAHDPGVPIDLEAIVLKCLEKDRSARYDSARALADDLGRFLHGEPVTARPAGTWYRLRKRLTKHRRLVAAAAVAFAAIVVAVGWAISTHVEAGEREQFAQRFTEVVESIESTARYSALSPRHDVQDDRKAIRAKMAEIEAEIERGGEVAAGPGHYALGRGYLALDDDARAREELESAWNQGFREPRVAYALAQAIGHLYQRSLLAAERTAGSVSGSAAGRGGANEPAQLRDVEASEAAQRDAKQEAAELREARKHESDRQYRGAILAYLAASKGTEQRSTEYFAALDAYYEGHFDEALRHLDAAGGGLPWWFYEALELRGDTLFARALAFRGQGEKERARADFAAGRSAYAAAASIGKSVPAVQRSLAALEYAAAEMDIDTSDAMPSSERALAVTTDILAMVPDDYDTLVLEAKVRLQQVEREAFRGGNAERLLTAALDDAQRAVSVAPGRPEARLEMVRIYRQWGEHRSSRGQDPRDRLAEAIEVARMISPQDRDATYHLHLGITFSLWADYEDQHGADGREHRSQSIDAYIRALGYAEASHRRDQQRDIWINVAIARFERATMLHAKDPDTDLQQAITAIGKARLIDPNHFVSAFVEGRIYEALAQRSRARGGDPRVDLRNGLASYRRALDINHEVAQLHNGVGSVFQALANAAWDRGDDPGPLLEQAEAAFLQAISLAPQQGYGYNNVGEVHIQRAGFQRTRGEDPSASAKAAVAMLHEAIARIPNHPTFRANLARAYCILAAYELEHGRDPRPSLRSAVAALQPVLGKGSSDAQAQVYVAETQGLYARLAARQGRGKAGEFQQVARAFEHAIALDPDNEDHAILFGQFCRVWAMFERDTSGDPGPALTRGRALANQLLAHHPSWPDALVLRANLALMQAQRAADVAEQRTQAQVARRDFADAFANNPALDRAWHDPAALAQKLAATHR